jgi:hypothetical protein
MTDSELHDAILADADAKARADAGDDSGAAARMAAVLPPILTSTSVTTRSVYAAFADPADGRQVVAALKAVAAQDPAANPSAPDVALALEWMQPANGGIDLSNASVRAMLDQLAAAGAITAAQAAALKALAERPAAINADAVSRAWAPIPARRQDRGLAGGLRPLQGLPAPHR